jgi:hypothetical protein
MATSSLKSASITALDTVPLVIPNTGSGTQAMTRQVSDTVTALAADAAGSTYRLCRFPTSSKVKAVRFTSVAQGAGAVRLDVAFSDSAYDNTPLSLQGSIPTDGTGMFGTSIAVTSAVTRVDETYANEVLFPIGSGNSNLWSVLGYTADPGGNFDIVATVLTALTNGGAIEASVDFAI